MDSAPRVYEPHEWQARCTACGRTRSLRNAGGYRIGLKPVWKRTVGWCRSCRGLSPIAIEPRQDRAG